MVSNGGCSKMCSTNHDLHCQSLEVTNPSNILPTKGSPPPICKTHQSRELESICKKERKIV
ncbi:hypothetical protein ACS0TY_005687 [Phlomoides rotata]